MAIPSEVQELIARFDRNRDSYRSPHYKETQVRREFIDPFFIALGWDVENKQGYAEAYKDVVHEDAVKVGGGTKAPDYCFRIGGTRKFFVETKKPAVSIKTDVSPAYQLRRYAWSAKLPLSILTDFEEFAVYDCRVKPAAGDKASVGRTMYFDYAQYAERWDEIASIFAREAILKGSFDKYAEKKRKRGTAEVDAAFLKDIEAWRQELARGTALRNPALTTRELNFAVQRTIDRIIFLRICEDRGIEELDRLRGLLNGTQVYARLFKIFQDADDRYNSGLFHFNEEKERAEGPDELTPGLTIDDKLLKAIIKGLYYPDSPYEFSVLPADILGHVYEQFLGKVIRLTPAHRAVVEDKPEVKKAGGVYYTPTYIVDYIVQNTVGKLLEKSTPDKAAKLRILDPACGSGSFLIGAYQYLLDWHRKYYEEHNPASWARKRPARVYEGRGGWRLTTAERKRILLKNIYGVDIDPQAVEVTKLSLLLKVLEGESGETLERQRRMFHERALPDLASNIKCGNSLIGPDFYDGKQLALLDDEERYRMNVFDWRKEFPDIMRAGGFDAVIGNPPYVRQESLGAQKEYFASRFEAFDGIADLYAYFLEQGVKLLRDGGRFSMIVSSSLLRATYAQGVRRVLKKHGAVLRIVDFGGLPVFANAKDTYVCIPVVARGAKAKDVEVCRVDSPDVRDLEEHFAANHYTIAHNRLTPEAWALKSDAEAAVFEKIMEAGTPLGDYVERRFFRGLLTGLNRAFELTERERATILKASPASQALIKRFVGGQDIRRYYIEQDLRYLIVVPSGWTRQHMSLRNLMASSASEKDAWAWFRREHRPVAEHLLSFQDGLKKRRDQGEFWWELRPCAYYAHLDAPKIVFPDICKAPRFTLDRSGIYLANTAYCLGTDSLYLLGILNSRLFWFAIGNISIPFGVRAGKYRYRLIYQYMEQVPVRPIDLTNAGEKALHDRMVSLVDQMLAVQKQLASTRTAAEQTALRRQIAATDVSIDRLVYELYGLKDEEIRIVEGASDA
jgi:hypothetical protein